MGELVKTRAQEWRETGATLRQRYEDNAAAYAGVGIDSAEAYFPAIVKSMWPDGRLGPLPRRYMREGFTAAAPGR